MIAIYAGILLSRGNRIQYNYLGISTETDSVSETLVDKIRVAALSLKELYLTAVCWLCSFSMTDLYPHKAYIAH